MNLSTVDSIKRAGQLSGQELTREELDGLKSTMVEILSDVLEICEANDISVTMSGGTCLGAVRHNGYIPWDDDIDINMFRADVSKFIELFEKQFAEKYWVHAPGRTAGYELDLLRIRKRGTVVRTHDDTVDGECGAYIEIFILENVPNNPALRTLHGFISLAIGFLLSCRRYRAHYDKYLALFKDDEETIKPIRLKARIGALASFASVDWWLKLWDRWNALCSGLLSDYVTIPAGRAHYFGELHRRDVFFPTASGTFENLEVPLPGNADAFLKGLYGENYMTPPPLSERETHTFVEFKL